MEFSESVFDGIFFITSDCELNGREQNNENHDDEGHRGRVTEIGGIFETGVINILRNGHRPVCGSALRDILDLVEKLQRPDRGRNGHEENDRLQLRRRDAEKGPHGACAVKLRRLIPVNWGLRNIAESPKMQYY